VPKIVSECCELVKLCHINCNGPVFFLDTMQCLRVASHKLLVIVAYFCE